MQMIRNLIRSDLIMMNGRKKELYWFGGILLAVMLLALIVSPLLFGFVLPLFALLLPSHLFKLTAEAEQMNVVLPTDRKSIVTARFLLIAGAFSAVVVICWLLALLRLLIQPDGTELDQALTELISFPGASALYNCMIWLGYLVGMAAMGIILNKSFCKRKSVTARVSWKGILLVIGIFYALDAVIVLLLTLQQSVPLVNVAFSALFAIAGSLSGILSGISMMFLMITTGVGALLSGYVKTVIQYDKTEL